MSLLLNMNNILLKNNISFKAIPIKKTSVIAKESDNSDKFVPKEVSVVKFDPNSMSDINTMKQLKNSWTESQYAYVIYCKFYDKDHSIFALTTQNDGYENIDPNNVLGLIDYKISGENANLWFLETAKEFKTSIQDNNSGNENRSIKNVGKTLFTGTVDYLKSLGIKKINLLAVPSAKQFYSKVFPSIRCRTPDEEDYSNMVLDI